jgi:magnesium-transporting ATPase (P-type)
MQTLPSISTNSPFASMIPVAYTILAGVFFELLADLRRRKNDYKINNINVYKLYIDQNGLKCLEETKSSELKVGDVIMIENNNQVLADCLLLYANDKNG